MSTPTQSLPKIQHLIVGTGLGLFFGLLIGLAVSPVVSGLSTAIVAIAVGWGALTTTKEGDPQPPPPVVTTAENAATFRLIGFSFTAVFGMLLGLYLRTHNILSPSFKDKVTAWEKQGFTKNEAKSLSLIKDLGGDEFGAFFPRKKQAWQGIGFSEKEARELVAKQNSRPNREAKLSSPQPSPGDTGLFKYNSVKDFEHLDPNKYPEIKDALLIYETYSVQWKTLAESLAGLEKEQQRNILKAAWGIMVFPDTPNGN